MKPICLSLALLASAAHGELVITEVMASSSHPTNVAPTPDANGDWWELTNTGSVAVDLTGYKWDDVPTPLSPTVSIFPPGVTIQPGESIIILEEPSENVATWKAAWGLSTTRVLDRTQFSNMGGEGFSGLGTSGDEVNLYDSGSVLVAHVEFGASVPGKSQAFHRDRTAVYGLHSEAGLQGAAASNLSPLDVGSPGDAALHFISPPAIFANSTYTYPVVAENPGGAAPVISATGLPAFLTLTPGSNGTATLSSNRALTLLDTGDYMINITATSGAASTIQEYLLTVLNPSPSVILNEYNAVAPTNFLNGGTAFADDDGGTLSTDSRFGRVAGNGGQWAEFVVVGNGGSGNLDMRGWSVEIGTNGGTGFYARNKLVLSNNTKWQTVPTGTILTFTDKTTAQGGCNTGFALRDRSTTLGDIWTNIWMGDATYLTYTSLSINGYSLSGGVVSGVTIDNNSTQFRVKNSAGAIVFGPVGEGVAPLAGTNSKEVFELEGHPTASVSPDIASSESSQGYDDGASDSTFGFPNNFLVGATPTTQLFTAFATPEIAVEQPAKTNIADGGSKGFGTVTVGTNTSLTFTIKNTGSAALTGLAITTNGTNAADFTVTANPVAPVAALTGSTTFTVRFTPTSAGAKIAAIHIANNDNNEAPFDINLTGTGYVPPPVPEIAVFQPKTTELVDGSATKKKFGTIKIGVTSATKTFTIKNTGTANLTGIAITLTGTNPKNFIVTTPALTTLAPGASTSFKVSFKPTAVGIRKATLHIGSNDADENTFDIKLSGTGSL